MSPVRWPLAIRVASKVAGRYPLEGSYHDTLFARQAPDLVARAAELVAGETRLASVGVPDVGVVSRREWIESNVRVFAELLAPVERRLQERSGVGRNIAERIVGVELGALLGVLARRVLGQYEMVLPTGGEESGDAVFFVGGNLLAMERASELRPSEFRFWVALHECTHRFQFVGVPWLRGYFLDLVEEMVASSIPEPGRVARVSGELRRAASAGEPLVGETGLMGIFATPEQRDLLDRVQALMSLLEGHGHVIMDRIGRRVLVTQPRMSAILRRRRQDPRAAAFFRLTGLEMKMKQYEIGEAFVLGVERDAGFETLDIAWRGPEYLPTLDEIREPGRWLSRVA